MKKVLICLTLLLIFLPASAYRIVWGRTVTISRPVYEDLYVAGGTITINAPVYGDLIVAGGNVSINDSIMNDLLLLGGTVHINGYVVDDIRCAGGQLHVMKSTGGDLAITGGEVEIDRDVTIAGGLMTSGGTVIFNGIVNGPVQAYAGKFAFNGVAGNNFSYHGDKLMMNGTVNGVSVLSSRQMTIGENASFNNSVRFWNKKGSQDFAQSLKNGRAVYDPSLKIKGKNWYFLGHSSVFGLFWYVGMVFLFIIVIQYLFSNTMRKAGDTVFNSSLKSLGWGLLFLIVVPLATLLLLLSIIGIPLGLLLLFSYIGLIILATIITSVVVANWLNNRFNYHWSYWQLVMSALALFILFKLLTFTPFLGWFIMMVLACIAFGALLLNINWHKKSLTA